MPLLLPSPRPAAVLALGAALAACTPGDRPPLLFGQHETLGVSIGTSAAGSPQLTLGFRDEAVAVIPVETATAGGAAQPLTATEAPPAGGPAGAAPRDTLSVLGQFDDDVDGSKASDGLGQFFATGFAARHLASGFAERMKRGGTTAAPGS